MRAGIVIAAVAMLGGAGCASVPRGGPAASSDIAPPGALARQAAHETAVGLAAGDCAAPAWALEGRVAVANGRDGGSGRIEWTQRDGRFDVALSAPVTRQSWRLSGGAGPATLDGLAGGTRTGPDAAQLLEEATGWIVPVEALGCWVRGARADAARFGPARLRWRADGALAGLEQNGWSLTFDAWQPAATGASTLPARVTATRADARVRLVVDAWSGPPAP